MCSTKKAHGKTSYTTHMQQYSMTAMNSANRLRNISTGSICNVPLCNYLYLL